MRILHVVPSYLPATRYGGPIYSVHGLCAALARLGHDVHVATTNVDGVGVSAVPLETPQLLDLVHVTYFGTGLGRRLYRAPRMKEALERMIPDFDVVHLHSVFLWPTTAAARTAKRQGVPFLLAPRGMLVPELINAKSRVLKRAWIAAFERWNVANAAAIHVTTDLERRDIERLGLKASRFELLPNAIDIPSRSLTTPEREANGVARIICLGRLSWKKGIDRLIRAMRFVPGASLSIVGNDDENIRASLEQIARDEGVSERVAFRGAVYGTEKWRLLAEADIFALASHSENFGIAVLEAMASGLPVVVTPEVGLADEVQSARAGLVAAGEPRAFAQALAHFVVDANAREVMGENGRRCVMDRFSWDAVARRCEEVYQSVSTPLGRRRVTASVQVRAS